MATPLHRTWSSLHDLAHGAQVSVAALLGEYGGTVNLCRVLTLS